MNLVLQLKLQFLSLLSTTYFNVFFFHCLNLFFFFPDKKQKTFDKITFSIEKRHQCIVYGVQSSHCCIGSKLYLTIIIIIILKLIIYYFIIVGAACRYSCSNIWIIASFRT